MGIKQLSALLKKVAPSSLNDWHSIDDYKGKTIAIDASPCLYQCLTTSANPGSENDTSHISGFLRRTIRLLELGIKPVFVFDGEAPPMKKATLDKRQGLRSRSQELLEQAEAAGDSEGVRRYSARLVKTTQKHNDDIIELLQLMGLPAVQAPSEAECLCCHLAISGRVDLVATEDLDALVFGAPKLLRFLHQGTQAGGRAIQEINLEGALSSLKLSHSEFIDLCILAGCDYLGTIERIGVHTAYQLMSKHRSIEAVLDSLDTSKHKVPEGFNFDEVRRWFKAPDVGDVAQFCLELKAMQSEQLQKFLVDRHQLSAAMVSEYIQRLARATGCDQQRPQLMPAVPHATPTPLRAQAARSLRRQEPAASRSSVQLEKGQSTLLGFVKTATKRSIAEDAPAMQDDSAKAADRSTDLKRRRTLATDILSRQLGDGIEVPASAHIDELEGLASLLASPGSGMQNSFVQGEVVALD
jgi:flap endonuclease-1